MRVVAVMIAALTLGACGAQSPSAEPSRPTTTIGTTVTSAPTPAPSPSTLTTSAAPSPKAPPTPSESADPRWRFYTDDHAWHTSPWFEGSHQVMIGFGCNTAPWYSHDSRCPGREGFHHGIDVAMPCGTRLFSDVRGTVVDPSSAGSPGAAYGPYAFRIRTQRRPQVDILIGHVKKVYVVPGDAVRPGRLIARANDQGAPDGCHLHFEVRRAGGGLADAIDPASYLHLSR